MSAAPEKMISETDAVKRERAAFRKGAAWQRLRDQGSVPDVQTDVEAKRVFPLPPSERPRMVRRTDSKYGVLLLKIEDGEPLFCYAEPDHVRHWHQLRQHITDGNSSLANDMRCVSAALLDAYDRPTELVPADD